MPKFIKLTPYADKDNCVYYSLAYIGAIIPVDKSRTAIVPQNPVHEDDVLEVCIFLGAEVAHIIAECELDNMVARPVIACTDIERLRVPVGTRSKFIAIQSFGCLILDLKTRF